MVKFRVQGWDSTKDSWCEIEVEASSLEDASQIVKYRDHFERIVDLEKINLGRITSSSSSRHQDRTADVEVKDRTRTPSRGSGSTRDSTSLKEFLNQDLINSQISQDTHQEALYLGALKIALRENPGRDLRSCDTRYSGYRFIHYYLRDRNQNEVAKVNLSMAQSERKGFLCVTTSEYGRKMSIIDEDKKSQLINKINQV